ncbi:MAG: FAD-dependent oxidoreductase [Trueperaceae bacterium]|nr:FAD-dependent oxidoreductase [Trueperaceae bacterium]
MSFFFRWVLLGLVFTLLGFSSLKLDSSSYDVIVVGSEPEGIMAAVAAAEAGASTLLVSEDSRVGGLFVLGEMNSLDLKTDPFNYQQGLFLRWWTMVGKGHAFDVQEAEKAFLTLLQRSGVTVRLGAGNIEPIMEAGVAKGISVTSAGLTEQVRAKQIIDSTSEMTFATKAGANYSFGFSSIGFNARMADTLVFKISGVNWNKLKAGIQARGKDYASVDDYVAWGHFGGYPAAYKPQFDNLRLRGLNMGKQSDGSLLVNALLIYGINPFDEASLAAAKAQATDEAPRIIDYLKKELPGFENAHFGGVAEKLYIRETRHLKGSCTLTVDHILNNHVSPLDVVAGGYPLDVQTLTPYDSGYVYGKPDIYGAQLCVTLPDNLENLWVVGKAASFDPIAASSARVVPFGMALGEAVGLAASLSAQRDRSSHGFIAETQNTLDVRALLWQRGAYLPQVEARVPVGPFNSPYYRAYRLMLSRGLAVGGYSNDPNLDKPMPAISYVYLLSNVGQRFLNNADLGKTIVASYPDSSVLLNASLALNITHDTACLAGFCVEKSWQALLNAGIISESFENREVLTRGEMYHLAADIAALQPRIAQQQP